MAYFRRATTFVEAHDASLGLRNAVVMGRKTWESIPAKFRPLPGRTNVVISQTCNAQQLGIQAANGDQDEAHLFTSLEDAVSFLSRPSQGKRSIARIFVIGGAQLYDQAFKSNLVDRLLITRIMSPTFDECDAFLPEFRSREQIERDEAASRCDGHVLPTTTDEKAPVWIRQSHEDLKEYLADKQLACGVLSEGHISYEFQAWVRREWNSE